jgi:DNA sulfur modification protein DndC
MYRNAQAGECPLVVDTTTPSCGNSRFGCWVCTVVERDRSMEAMIDSGEDWLEPLLEFRDLLAETQTPEKKRLYREFRRRNGHVSFIRGTDTPVPGPYTLTYCKTLLERLLETQVRVQREAPPGDDTLLIHDAELHEIRRIWRAERGDWADSVPTIVRAAIGRELDWVMEDSVRFTAEDGRLLEEVCSERSVPTELIIRLLDVERAAHGLKRRHAIHTRIEELFRQEWRDLETVLQERLGSRSADIVEVDDLEEADALELPLGDAQAESAP